MVVIPDLGDHGIPRIITTAGGVVPRTRTADVRHGPAEAGGQGVLHVGQRVGGRVRGHDVARREPGPCWQPRVVRYRCREVVGDDGGVVSCSWWCVRCWCAGGGVVAPGSEGAEARRVLRVLVRPEDRASLVLSRPVSFEGGGGG